MTNIEIEKSLNMANIEVEKTPKHGKYQNRKATKTWQISK